MQLCAITAPLARQCPPLCRLAALHFLRTSSLQVYRTYGGKFSRRIISAFFADWHRTSKIKLREVLKCRIDALILTDPDP